MPFLESWQNSESFRAKQSLIRALTGQVMTKTIRFTLKWELQVLPMCYKMWKNPLNSFDYFYYISACMCSKWILFGSRRLRISSAFQKWNSFKRFNSNKLWKSHLKHGGTFFETPCSLGWWIAIEGIRIDCDFIRLQSLENH